MARLSTRSPGLAGTGEGEISTFGWDTAFAVRIENVNAAIKNRRASPHGFSYTDPGDANVHCSGAFGDWAVVRGGDGGGVNVRLPIQNVRGQMKASSGYTAYSCAGAAVTVTVRLHFFDAEGNKKHLKVKPTSDSPDVPAVEPYDADFSQHPVQPPAAVYAIQAALLEWCMSNLGAFVHVFSIVDINDEADRGVWAFLKPTEVSYAYTDGDSDADAFLGVLAMTMGESSGGLQQVLDTRIVQAGEEGAFCISRTLLLKKLIFPNLQALWPNLRASQVTFAENVIVLNAHEAVDLPQTEYQGTSYTPQLREFSFTIEGPQITVKSYTVTQVQDGVQAWCRATARYTITKGTNKQGQATLAYSQLGTPQVSHGHDIAEWVKITDDILAIVVGIGVAVLVVLTDGAAAVVIAVVGALIAGAIAVAPEISGLIEDNDAPAIDLLQENIYAPMVWTDSSDFVVDTVDLDGSLRLGGALGFGSAPPASAGTAR